MSISAKLRRRLLVVGVVAVLASAAYLWWRTTLPGPDELALAARVARSRGRADEARHIIERAVLHYPHAPAVCVAAAEMELARQQDDAALAHLERALYDGSSAALTAIGSAGDILYRMRRMEDAEERFRRVLSLDPANIMARQRLARLSALAGRRTDAQTLFFEVVKAGDFNTHDLALLGDPELAFRNAAFVDLLSDPSSRDARIREGAARLALFQNEGARAVNLYREIAARSPADVEIQAGYGRALLEAGRVDDFPSWYAALPSQAFDNAEIWDVCGRYAQQRQEYDVAIRCCWEALRRDPNLRQPHYQLAGLLRQRGETELAHVFRERGEKLHAFSDTLALVHIDVKRVDVVQHAAELAAALERPWETWGWVHAVALRSGRQDDRAQADRLRAALDETTPLTLASGCLARVHDLSNYPAPAWREATASGRPVAGGASPHSRSAVRFVDMAAAAGLNFTYYNDDDPDEPGIPIWKSSGGGVAALDFDGDLWPDIYFTQGCEWPPQAGQTKHLDRLFRNLGNGRFADVTDASGLGDERFGQGVSAGDFNGDGFSDLHVANIFANRLYCNNGDGTFSDVTEAAGIRPGGWTTSSLIADLNGDALPEIYEVTYVAGREPFEHVCHDKERSGKSVPRTCSPTVFAAEPDRLYLNRGDGRFEDISERAGIQAPNGKGLGIAAGDFNGSGRISLYVANDTTANFLFVNQTTNPGDEPRFEEQAILAGCALDSDGRAQASMGIAVDDSDGDGLLDLYITNFHREYYTLYRQLPGGMFADVSSSSGLKPENLVLLGFGTQFLDGDLDGRPDLVVANGSVDDFREHGLPFRMRAQYFANRGEGIFGELPPAQLGDYFERELLGRALARVDWNRDGRDDFVVSNLDSPAALVTNVSPVTGHSLTLYLRGATSNRDAIGAVVEVHAGDRRLWKHLTAGDGYQCSNERKIVIGLGASELAEKLIVRWPAGGVQEFAEVAADAEYILIEGRDGPARLEVSR